MSCAVRQRLPLVVELAITQGSLLEAGILARVIRGLAGEQIIHSVAVGGDAAGGDQGSWLLLLQYGAESGLQAEELRTVGKMLTELGQQGDQPLPDLAPAFIDRDPRQGRDVIECGQRQFTEGLVELFQPSQGGQILARLQRRQGEQQGGQRLGRW
ncbi:hypothetical protein D3C80_1264670 [compost metagenome]